MTVSTLQTKDLTFHYGKRPVFSEVNLEVGPGLHAVRGGNGSGKSTLLRLLATAVPPPAGTIFLNGRDVGERKTREAARQSLSYLPQATRPDSRLVVSDWLDFGAWLQEVPRPNAAAVVRAAATTWQLGELLVQRMAELSVGQRRRVDLARALMRSDLDLLVLDEPFAALDTDTADLCKRQLLERAEAGTIVLYADPAEHWSEAHEVLHLPPAA